MGSAQQTLPRRGRKSLFRGTMIREGYQLGALGLTGKEIANFWSVSSRTLERWQARYPDFAAAIRRGRNEADATVIKALLDQARAGNVTAAIFWLKNRQPAKWSDGHAFREGIFGSPAAGPALVRVVFAAVGSRDGDYGSDSAPRDLP
jgi:hypothetical protein